MATRKRPNTRASIRRTFKRRWHAPSAPGAPSEKKVFVTAVELRELVVKQLGKKLSKDFGFYIADATYFCPPVKDAREIIRNSSLDQNTWVADKFDCDDFAHVLKGHFSEAAYKNGKRRKAHCFGVVWGSLPGPHAINWMVNADMKIRFVEPQTDAIYFPKATDRDIYFMLV